MNISHAIRVCRGVSIVEVVIGVSIAALAIAFMSHTIVRYASVGTETLDRTRAVFLAEEGLELVRYLHDDSWTNMSSLTSGTSYYLTISTTTIATTTVPALIDGQYTRTITTSPVYRATANDDIVASTSAASKALDPDTVLVTATVLWGTPTTTVRLSEYLAHY